MSEHIVTREQHTDAVINILRRTERPYTVILKKGKVRSLEQNRLQHMWFREASSQLQDHTPEEYRAYCKLHFGIPILRGENEDFRMDYDRIVRQLPYEDKLKVMGPPIEFPVTRIMTTGQKTRYLADVYAHFTSLGVILTDPDDAQIP